MQSCLLNCISCNKITLHNQQFTVNKFSIIKCSECGLGSAEVNSKFSSKEIYKKSYFEGGQKDGYSNYQRSKKILRIEFNTIKNQILKYKPKLGGRLLEIGCAYGYFLETLSSLFKVYGTEISDHAVNKCNKKGLNVINYSEFKNSKNLGFFDVVVMLDVIEHLTDPIDTFQKLSCCTKKDSLLIISRGDFGSCY